jgi:hypothetical protein
MQAPDRNARRRVAIALVGCAALALVTLPQWQSCAAHRRLDDLAWLRTATPAELRRTAHLALGSWGADPHDAFVILAAHGDRSSLPFLRAALARQPDGDAVACTWAHGQDAVKRILAATPD